MTAEIQTQEVPPADPDSRPGKTKWGRFWQVFWLSFLVVSLSYAWYCFYAPSNQIAWVDDYAVAQQRAAEEDKQLILFFTGAVCSPCQIMKRQVWADDEVMAEVNEAFIPVMFEVGSSRAADAESQYGVRATPTTIFADPDGNLLHHKQGKVSKADFLDLLGKLNPPVVEGS